MEFVFAGKILWAKSVAVTITLELLKSVVIIVRKIKVGNKGTKGICKFVQTWL